MARLVALSGIGVLDVGEVEEEDGVGVGARVVLAHLLVVVQALPAGNQQYLNKVIFKFINGI